MVLLENLSSHGLDLQVNHGVKSIKAILVTGLPCCFPKK